MWPLVVEVLGDIYDDAVKQEQKCIVEGLLENMQTFKFVVTFRLMKDFLENY